MSAVRDIQKSLKADGVSLTFGVDRTTNGPASIMLVDPDGNTFLIDQQSAAVGLSSRANFEGHRAGGETGIRTLGTVARTVVFETTPFDHSGISPRRVFLQAGCIVLARSQGRFGGAPVS